MIDLKEVKLYSKNKATEAQLIDELRAANDVGDRNQVNRAINKILLYYTLTKNEDAKRYYNRIKSGLEKGVGREKSLPKISIDEILNDSYDRNALLIAAKMPKMTVSGLLHYICDFTGVMKIQLENTHDSLIWLYLRVSCYHGGGVRPNHLKEIIGCGFGDPFDTAVFAEIEQFPGEIKFIEVKEGIESMPGFKQQGDSVRHLLLDSMTKMDNFKAGINTENDHESDGW